MDRDADVRKEILAAASAMKIRLDDPANAFTLWCCAKTLVGHIFVFCGGRTSLQDAMALGREFVQLKTLVILSANPKHGLTWIPDDDRARSTPAEHPGSGF